ncbi:phosphoglucosamine mutase [Humidisolicoccus flavus]|uniref:phosphoglucosamine mutase n=1 Tax=Humidisolicoccus flavus TaxID=3111414 RepID=UPI00324C6D18
MSRLFGTDGVRGLAGSDITAEFALSLAQGAAIVLGREARRDSRRPVAVVARDPRISGEFITAAVAAGLASSGVDVFDAGVIPTPAAAFLIADLGADFGVMISASHNPAPDNGIKFFARGGKKLSDSIEDEIERAVADQPLRPVAGDVGRVRRFADAEDRYVVHLLGTLRSSLQGVHVVIDCANGASSAIAPDVFADAGATITVIGNEPDGLNINREVGSTHLEGLQKKVVELGADLGIANDGDADRCLAVDGDGNVVDGDQIMAILALAAKRRGELRDDTLVATVMSNLGLKVAMDENDIQLVQTKVGDRYVLEALGEYNLSLGGEQSGHIIFSDYATTGDGVLTGLQLAAEVVEQKKSLRELASVMTVYPQIMINVAGVDRLGLGGDSVIHAAVEAAEAELGDTGRVLLRPSGTEKIIRVMVEASEYNVADRIARDLAALVKERLGTSATE